MGITTVLLSFPIFLPDMFIDQTHWLEALAKSVGYEGADHYVIIIDAGTTGSRVHAFKFNVPYTVSDHPTLNLIQEYYEDTSPGLSSFANDPAMGAEFIVHLIKNAEHMIPESKRNETPIIVRATAGLRLLPEVKAHQLIDYVSLAIDGLGYATPVGQEAVTIMSGSDEGIFMWYTVNLLTDMLGKDETMVALDLGGGSTQITYQINDLNYSTPEIHVMQAGKNFTLYSHSYLNLGLMAARYGIFRMEADLETTEFTSVCFDPHVQLKPWMYGNEEYHISGAAHDPSLSEQDIFNRCYGLVKSYVMKTLDWEPPYAPVGRIAGTSSFFYVAFDAEIIDDKKGGVVHVGSYRDKALTACSTATNYENPFECIDLIYIYTLLHDVYKFDKEKEILVVNKINGYKVSWALGLAYNTVIKTIIDNTWSILGYGGHGHQDTSSQGQQAEGQWPQDGGQWPQDGGQGQHGGGHNQHGGGQGQHGGGQGQHGGGQGQHFGGQGQHGGAQGQQDGGLEIKILQDDDLGEDQRFTWHVPGSPFSLVIVNK